MRLDSCPSCARTITSFARPIGMLACPYCKADLKYVLVPPEGHYGAYRKLVKNP